MVPLSAAAADAVDRLEVLDVVAGGRRVRGTRGGGAAREHRQAPTLGGVGDDEVCEPELAARPRV